MCWRILLIELHDVLPDLLLMCKDACAGAQVARKYELRDDEHRADGAKRRRIPLDDVYHEIEENEIALDTRGAEVLLASTQGKAVASGSAFKQQARSVWRREQELCARTRSIP